jgi:RNA-directed DNA polymerase
MSAAEMPAYEWQDLNWRAIEKQVFKLQKRIYRASARGDTKTVHQLQRLLMRSWSAKCLAVRKVTQDNRGKKTAGVDGLKSLSPAGRLRLVGLLNIHAKPKPTRRVWIPKPGTDEKRPLGILVLHDRAAQALVKLALEPEWEAHFEPNSYGFRPGRSAHDAQEAIFCSIKQRAKYALDADIAHCFDRINHEALLKKLKTFPTLRQTIKHWLTAGVQDGDTLFPTTEGTPQGGVLSPLLANVALHGLETFLVSHYPKGQTDGGQWTTWRPTVVRYADDFVVLHHKCSVIEECRELTTTWLAEMGLTLKPSKTRITHTLTRTDEGHVGFDFLGWTIRQHPVGKTHSGKVTGHLLGFKTIITPSKDACKEHLAQLAEIIRKSTGERQADLITKLNRTIGGWTNYHATCCAKETFSKMQEMLFLKLKHWARRRHPHKSARWRAARYWHADSGQWDFSVPNGPSLSTHRDKAIARHVKVKGTKSPYDGDTPYWASRLGRSPDLPPGVAPLLKKQQGRCAWCGRLFTTEDIIEKDHVIPKPRRSTVGWTDRQLLHGHGHDAKSAQDGSYDRRGTPDNEPETEEPDEGKARMSGFGGGRGKVTSLA